MTVEMSQGLTVHRYNPAGNLGTFDFISCTTHFLECALHSNESIIRQFSYGRSIFYSRNGNLF